jgi:hypothetical protein
MGKYAGVKYAPNDSPPEGAVKIKGFIFHPNPPAPTETFGYWTTYDVPVGGYGVYLNKASQGPSIYAPSNDTEFINLYYAFAAGYVSTGNTKMALSLSKVNPSYNGTCLTIRRVSDNNETNIGFVGNDLDITSINTFCSGTKCYVKKWFDQYQSGADAIQNTAGNQPLIYDGGITTSGSLPVIYFYDGNSRKQMSGTFIVNGLNEFTMNIRADTFEPDNSVFDVIKWEDGTAIYRVLFRIDYSGTYGLSFGTNSDASGFNIPSPLLVPLNATKFYQYQSVISGGVQRYINLNSSTPMSSNTSNYVLNPDEEVPDSNVYIREIIVSNASSPPLSGVDTLFAYNYINNFVPESVIIFSETYQNVLNYALTQGWSLPTIQQQFRQNTLLTTLINEGIFSELDTFYVMANNGSQEFSTINWVNPGTNNLIAAGATPPTFSSGNGWRATGAGYMDTQFYFTGSTKLQQTSATAFVFINTAANGFMLGHAGTAGLLELTLRLINQNSANTRIMTNNNSTTNTNFAGTGLKAAYSTASNTQSYYNDGVLVQSQTVASAGPDTLNPVSIFRSANSYAAVGQVASVMGFGANTVSKEQQLSDAINTYMTNRNV